MLHIQCTGSPYQIGQQHGSGAASRVKGSIAFYQAFFKKTAKLPWAEAEEVAKKFLPYLQSQWPAYVEEMQGLAEGAGVSFETILAMNVRTEIAYGLAMDGCTAFAWKADQSTFIGQNWDWENEQSPNIVSLHIMQTGKPKIHMMSEAGIIGKIGLNSNGVGVTLNAIRAKGVDFNKLPTHLALRTVLDSETQAKARQTLLNSGVAAACHITICDPVSGGIGLECTAQDITQLHMEGGICVHSNHLVKPHPSQDLMMLKDSPFRLTRMKELLLQTGNQPHMEALKGVLRDEKNYPAAICRAASPESSIETLFSIVMDLEKRFAVVKMGRPTEKGEEFKIEP